ncbi:hypothetical protein [Clostridium sp. Marseille-QA1073]
MKYGVQWSSNGYGSIKYLSFSKIILKQDLKYYTLQKVANSETFEVLEIKTQVLTKRHFETHGFEDILFINNSNLGKLAENEFEILFYTPYKDINTISLWLEKAKGDRQKYGIQWNGNGRGDTKYLSFSEFILKQGSKYYTIKKGINNDKFFEIPEIEREILAKKHFEDYGFKDISLINTSNLGKLSKNEIEVLLYIPYEHFNKVSLWSEEFKGEDFKYQIKLDNEIIKDYSLFDYKEVNEEITIPQEIIDVVKKGDKTHTLTVSIQDRQGSEASETCNVNIKNQRSFSRYFKPNVDYVYISGFPKTLSEITIQIIKRAKNEREFTCMTNNTLVSMQGNELKICGNSFEGWIYEVRVWEKDKERQWTGIPLKGDEEGLIVLYRMNELEGNICFDSTDNKLHGTYLGTEWSEIVPTGVKEGINREILIKDENAIVPQGKDYPYEYKITAPYMTVNEIHENDIENDIVEFKVDNDEYKDIESINLIG